MENNENKSFKDKLLDAFANIESAVNKEVDKMKEDYNEEKILNVAAAKFKEILRKQLVRVEDMKAQGDFVDYASLETIKIGVCGGDGIGPIISAEARRVLEYMLDDLVKAGKVNLSTSKVSPSKTVSRT